MFDYMLDVRAINDNIDTRRGSLFDEYTEARTAKFQMHSMEDYDRLKQVSPVRRDFSPIMIWDSSSNHRC